MLISKIKNMEKTQKRILLIGIILVVLFGVVLYLAQYFEKRAQKMEKSNKEQPVISFPEKQNKSETEVIPTQPEQAKPIVFESFEKWATYRSESMGIEIKYPHELFLDVTGTNKIVFDYLNPNDPEQKKEYAPLAEMRISLENESLDNLVSKRESEKPLNFKQREVNLNNITAQQVTYTSGFDGGTMYQTYIPHGNSTVVIWYPGDNQLESTFSKMLSTVKYSK